MRSRTVSKSMYFMGLLNQQKISGESPGVWLSFTQVGWNFPVIPEGVRRPSETWGPGDATGWKGDFCRNMGIWSLKLHVFFFWLMGIWASNCHIFWFDFTRQHGDLIVRDSVLTCFNVIRNDPKLWEWEPSPQVEANSWQSRHISWGDDRWIFRIL